MRAANAPEKPAWSPYAVIDKEKYKNHGITATGKNYKEVVFIGSQDSKLKQLMDAQGVIFAKKATLPSSLLYLVDGSRTLDASIRKEMQKQIVKGADVWIWGLTPETVASYNEILPFPVALDKLQRSSFLPVQKSWMNGLNNSDFYFCELQKTDASGYSLKGALVEEEVLLNACKTDWRKWNKRPEEIKTAGTIRSEYECTAATPVFVKCRQNASTFYLSTLTEFANSEKGYNTLTAILKNAGIAYKKPEVNIDEVFFLRDEQINFPVATKEKLVKDNGDEWALELYVFSPRPLDDLLIEPNMPKLSLMLKAKKRTLLINDKPYTAVSHDGRNEIIYKELPLLQGWNKLVIKIGAGDRNDFTGCFKCDNKKDFLPLLKAAFVNPEAK